MSPVRRIRHLTIQSAALAIKRLLGNQTSTIRISTKINGIDLKSRVPKKMYDQCVEDFHCGTDRAIWFNGEHPAAGEFGPRNAQVCASNEDGCDGNSCRGWKADIQVQLCPGGDGDAFYIYRLKKPPKTPSSAYCAGTNLVCLGDKIANPNRNKCTDKYPKIGPPIFGGEPVIEDDDFYFTCRVRWSDESQGQDVGGEQFEVIFTFDGKEVESVKPKITSNPKRPVKLYSNELKGQVGKNVSCKVRSYWTGLEKDKSEEKAAQTNYFVGIRYSLNNTEGSFTNPPITIDESDPALTLYFQPTVPFWCPGTNKGESNKLKIVPDDIEPRDGVGISDCTLALNHEKSAILKVKATPTPGIHQRTSVVQFLNISEDSDCFWNGYKPPNIPITITDNSKTYICVTSGDPHITTFDRMYYDTYQEGDFLLAKSTSPRHFEVHVRHHKCNSVSCNCAVAVREGNNVLGVNACKKPDYTPTPIIYLQDKRVPGATITNVGNTYTITMPSGAYATMVWSVWHSRIYLYLNSEDFNKTVGLCGTLNGKLDDDKVPKGEEQQETNFVPNNFTNSYRLNSKESFINGHLHPIKCVDTVTEQPNFCSCKGNRPVVCGTPAVQTKAFVTKFTHNCSKDWNYDDNEAEEEIVITETDLPPQKVDVNHGNDVKISWPTPGGIIKEKAEELCKGKLKASSVYSDCKGLIEEKQMENFVRSCVTDIQVTDDVDAALSTILGDFEAQCVHHLQTAGDDKKDPKTQTEAHKILIKVVAQICPAQCSGNGVCNNGTCTCNKGFAGVDCSVNALIPPEVTSFRKGSLCDSQSTSCTEIAIFVTNIYWTTKLSCRITVEQDGKEKHIDVEAFLISTGEVICRLPDVFRVTGEISTKTHGKDVTVETSSFHILYIKVTSDGALYSNRTQWIVYDSKCQTCSPDSATCTQKKDTCVIDGRCYQSGETSSDCPCKKCVPSKNPDKWTIEDIICADSILQNLLERKSRRIARKIRI